ncbi:hypothetical protein [Parasitella parasitica]|uniref:Protein RER1 n=1 Tax=Parasitella parasitica TaxID=35722 RepID=A0A0B7NVR9_9FUNG|nr:hypothetical protein [Parasitella parasitica]
MDTTVELTENGFTDPKSSFVAVGMNDDSRDGKHLWTEQHPTRSTDGFFLVSCSVCFSCALLLRKDGTSFGIYLLNMFLAFLTPKFDPSIEEEEEDEGPSLPTRNDEEFRPFIRRLPEFKFWYSSTKATIISLICSFIPAFDIPVFWPILLIYFCLLFALTMRRQIQHMIRYRYVPFDLGKKKYKKVVNMDTVGEASKPSSA